MNKNFIEIKIIALQVLSELLGNLLVENGCAGYITEKDNDKIALKGYVRERSKAEALVEKIYRYADSLEKIHKKDLKVKVELRRIKEVDWSKGWRKSFKPILVTDKIVIKPSWVRKKFPEKMVIEIEPKMAFGTGEHSTTRLCLKALERYVRIKDRVLDLGTGSGILAVAAAKLGASYVLALDIDEDAISNARENILKNKVQKIVELKLGTVDDNLPAGYFNLITANLTRTQIIELFEKMNQVLIRKGVFILSGIQTEEKKEMEEFLLAKKILLKETLSEKGWVCFVAEKV